jgi:hypothetical protein
MENKVINLTEEELLAIEGGLETFMTATSPIILTGIVYPGDLPVEIVKPTQPTMGIIYIPPQPTTGIIANDPIQTVAVK